MPHCSSVAIGVYVNAGSRDEQIGQYGASHFLEHLAFKGTSNLSARELAVMVDSFGGEMNAFTMKEMTSFQVRLLGEASDVGIDILNQILTEPALYPTDVESERSVILEEIAMAKDEPADLVHEQLNTKLFDGHPLGREVLGSRESITSMDRSSIIDFFSRYYGPNNMVVAAAGPVNHSRMVDNLSPALGGTAPSQVPVRTVTVVKVGSPVLTERDIEQVHVAIAYPGLSRSDSRRWAYGLLDQLLGGGLSSRLFQTVREEAGLCYTIYSDRVSFHDCGYMGIYFAASPAQVGKALELVDLVTRGIVASGITEDELSIAKRYLRAQVLLSLDDTSAVMSQIGSVLVTNRELRTVDEILKEIDRITVDDVMDVASLVLSQERQLSAVGPVPPEVLG